MDNDAFEAHLALHGFIRFTGGGMNVPSDRITRIYVDDAQLPDVFRLDTFVRIDQYGGKGLAEVEERAVPGFQEFGCCGTAAFFYTRKKTNG